MSIKVTYQHDLCDCGAACISMIASYYRLYYPLQRFREIVGTSKNGSSLHEMVEGGKKLGFIAEALYGSKEEMLSAIQENEIKLPFIAHMKKEHYIVISEVKSKRITIYDPQYGKKVITQECFFNEWTGYIINLVPSENFKPGNYRISTFKRIGLILASEWKKIAVVFLISIFVYLFGIVSSYTFQTVLECYSDGQTNVEHLYEVDYASRPHEENICSECDTFVPEVNSLYTDFISEKLQWIYEESGSNNVFFILLIVMLTISAVVSYIRGVIIIKLSQNIDLRTTYVYYKKILNIPIKDKCLRSNGDYLSRFADSYRIRYAISNASVAFFVDIVVAVIGVMVLCNINFRLFFIALTIITIYSFIVTIFKNRLAVSNKETMINNALMHSYFKEVLEGYETIKISSSEKEIIKVGSEKYQKMLEKYYSNDTLGLMESTLLSCIEMLGNICILWAGFNMVAEGTISVGSLITFINVLSYFAEPIKGIVMLQPTIQSAAIALERIFDIFDISSENYNNDGIDLHKGNIVFENIGFTYDNYITIFDNFSLEIQSGDFVGIFGKSGCGKSTLMKLLLRLYPCDRGRILINNHSIEEYKLEEIRKKISYVGQDNFLFEDTILYNITWDHERNLDDEVKKISELCCIDGMISDMSLGYNTYIRENGETLSQGQKQRVVLARNLLKKPDILILDEALSNVDAITMKNIMINIKEYMKGSTVIVISHAPEVLDLCDNVVCIDRVQNRKEII